MAAAVAALVACSPFSSSNTASHSPRLSPSPSPTASATATPSAQPQPVTGAYGVLVSSQAATSYTVSIVGIDGKVAGTAGAPTPPNPTCANTAAAVVEPPVSMSDSQVYLMDGKGAVYTVAPGVDESKAAITNLPAPTTSRRSMFAVSPDDAQIAVVVDDFAAGGATTRVYVNPLQQGAQNLIFSETGAFTLWPVGWHGVNNLVLAVVPSCTQGGGPFCCGPQELHVIDPVTATRRFTIGSRTGCVIGGPSSPSGVVCENRPDFKTGAVLNWTAGTVRTLALNPPSQSYLSPDGGMVMFVDSSGTTFTLGAGAMSGFFACTWLDSTHVMSGGDPQHQPRLADVFSQAMTPVAAQGDCAGRLPGGL